METKSLHEMRSPELMASKIRSRVSSASALEMRSTFTLFMSKASVTKGARNRQQNRVTDDLDSHQSVEANEAGIPSPARREVFMKRLEGKVAVITGGNSGIGLATAKRFVQEGAYVFITGRRQAELDKAVSVIGTNVTTVQGDVAKLDDLDHLYEVVKKVKRRVDIVFANAGVVDPVSLAESTPETFDKHFDLNARGAYFTVQKALPLLADKASIILSGSAAWQMGVPGFGAYSATKAALVSFVRSWTAELAARHSSQRDQSWTNGHAHDSRRRESIRGRYKRILPENDPHGTTRDYGRNRIGSRVPGFRREQLHQWNRPAGRWWHRIPLNRDGFNGAPTESCNPMI